jgi:hypothetical protein
LANALEARRGKRGGFQEGFHSNNRTHKSSLLISETTLITDRLCMSLPTGTMEKPSRLLPC